MKKLVLLATTAVLLASTPALAQVSIRAGEGGVGVRLGEPNHRSRTTIHQRRSPDVIVRRDRDDDDDCRTVTIRERDRFGNRVTKRIQRCD